MSVSTRPTEPVALMFGDDEALRTIPEVRLPDSDPVYGTDGPLTVLWRAATVAL